MIEAFGGRKFLAWIVSTAILLGIFLVLTFTGKLTDGIFIAWLGAMVVNLGLYIQGNVAVDKAGIAAGTKPENPTQGQVG